MVFLTTTFGTSGIVDRSDSVDDYFFGSRLHSLILQGTDILVAGTDKNDNALIVRFDTDGELDTGFGDGGLLTVPMDSGGEGGNNYSITLDQTGKILLTGTQGGSFALARYNTDGTLDTTFSGTPNFTTGRSAVVIDDNLWIHDSELSETEDYSGASLTLARAGGAKAADSFSFSLDGARFTVSDDKLQSSGQTFATFTNSDGTLTITFEGDTATPTQWLVNDVLQHIAYAYTGTNPPASVQLAWTSTTAICRARPTPRSKSSTPQW
jgi:uncharacterized delta-60 repeat protein